ncbi:MULTISPECIES: cytochrome c biogenesis CcdA family protein [Streptomyces]|uniref:cytochrome c biogenesis CcdA family protein n=1 Tax=Streptomyces TaxID=1883 RepID=UPI000241A8E3|nr:MULTISPECIES: cytochrome c biogenesis CcdA family protein [Streptomyces]EHM24193.1 putative cytochrome c biogenesis protein [Streptomyces sp. W007]MCX4516118.1 cytochrome c biogenesis CcdA family protein [Streptomyces anulatus]MCX4598945.1 cytochrome c biogenesis CcdA family protein [Streptomyces anulatus]WSU71504.1 cytochrome c biogenesis CcdA family protein [Streptomyces anulatus]WTD07801.1 cytochrome c biogenesis CcdA family protein [Streptomyces anulatus]
MSQVGLAVAFLGGLLALLSPCSALLLPAFFAYSFTSRTKLVARTGLFYLGLCTTLVPLGVAGSFASRLFYGHRDTLVSIGGWTVIALGVVQIAGLGFGSRRIAQAAGARRSGSALSVFALGAVYGLAGFCAGPILGGILTVAALDGDPFHGGALLAVYALGMAVPMFALALLWDRFDLGRKRWLRGRALQLGRIRLHSTSVIGGLVFITLGVVFLVFDGTSALPSLISTDTEFALEDRLSGIGAVITDRLVLLVLAAAVALGTLLVLLKPDRKRASDVSDREEPTRG